MALRRRWRCSLSAAIAAAFWSNWPIGFFVGALAVVWYVAGRGLAAWRKSGAR